MTVLNKKTIFETLGRQPIHPFPARMAPGIALAALDGAKSPMKVLDPMAGSGTVLAVALEKGHSAVGVDVDPLAVLLARVWTTPVEEESLLGKAEEVLRRARAICDGLALSKAYPKNADEETSKFIRYWFDNYSRRQLTALSLCISRIHVKGIRDALWAAFSRMIITKSSGVSLAMDLSHSRPHRAFRLAPVKPFNIFIAAARTIAKNCAPPTAGVSANVLLGDARALPIEPGTIDLVLTSPPYLNAIDYMRCSKFSLVWMGYSISDLRAIRSTSVGTEATTATAIENPAVPNVLRALRLPLKTQGKGRAPLRQYICDMEKSLQETYRVLKQGGNAVYVVGDSTVRGMYVRNSAIISVLADAVGFEQVSRHSRVLPANRRYLPPPSRQAQNAPMDGRMRREIVLTFAKRSG